MAPSCHDYHTHQELNSNTTWKYRETSPSWYVLELHIFRVAV